MFDEIPPSPGLEDETEITIVRVRRVLSFGLIFCAIVAVGLGGLIAWLGP